MAKLKWVDNGEESPWNGDLCIVQFSDGNYAIDSQHYGEWSYSDIKQWAKYDRHWFNNMCKVVEGV